MEYTRDELIEMQNEFGDLDLRGTQITALPDNLTVGGWLDLSGTQITYNKVNRLKNGDYVPGKYLYADNVLTHIRTRRKTKGYVFFVGKIPGKNVISDGKYFAHCTKFSDGRDDLMFKAAIDRGADQYKCLALDDPIPIDQAKTMYRVITGACRQGTEDFIANPRGELKTVYSIREIIELTKGQYGSKCFSAFWERE